MRAGFREILRAGLASLHAVLLSVTLVGGAEEAASGGAPREYANDDKIGIDEKLGELVPLDVPFLDEDGRQVVLKDLMTRPTILTLVYFRCPSICSPLMHELADVIDQLEMEAGKDFDLITISFDKDETPELATKAKAGLLGDMKKRLPPESWRFLTGDAESIMRVADAVGFRFQRDEKDFSHAGTVIFLSTDGKIVRYLPGLKMLPTSVKMAIIDAKEGRARSFFERVQKLCYGYDGDGKQYVFKVNRVILAVTLAGLGLFLVYLLAFRRTQTPQDGEHRS